MCRQVAVPQMDGRNDTDCDMYMLASMKKMVLWGAKILVTKHEELEQGRLSEELP